MYRYTVDYSTPHAPYGVPAEELAGSVAQRELRKG